jgi:hypothetical protein
MATVTRQRKMVKGVNFVVDEENEKKRRKMKRILFVFLIHN